MFGLFFVGQGLETFALEEESENKHLETNLYGKKGPVTNLELPRFVSLKSDDVNLRVGPSMNYPIELKYTQNNLPIEVIDDAMERDKFMSPEEAKAFGLVDKIITHRSDVE